MVLFAMLPDAALQGAGFGIEFQWDIPLLEGYEYRVLENVAKNPSVTRFFGCDTPNVRTFLHELRPDAVIVNGWVVKTCLQTLWACKRLGIPCLVRGEANDLAHRAAWKKRLQALLVRQYSACLYIGKQNRKFYRARGVNAQRLFSSPYCVENDRFSQAVEMLAARKNYLRDQWGVPVSSICFLYCGKFEQKKHPLDLLRAFALAHNAATNIHLLMVGDGALKSQCEEFANKCSLPVTFTGFMNQAEIMRSYAVADCLVLPSDGGETWGLVVNEAMACGLPAIVSDLVGCANDLVKNGKTGYTFTFGDWESLAEIMSRLSHYQQELKVMGSRARKRIGKYSPEIAAQGILNAVHETISHHTGT